MFPTKLFNVLFPGGVASEGLDAFLDVRGVLNLLFLVSGALFKEKSERIKTFRAST